MANAENGRDWAMTPTSFRILVVGVNNTCRSPLAAGTLQRELDTEAPVGFTVICAGTQAISGSPVSLEVLKLAEHRGIHLHGFFASQLVPETISEADLVLVMDRSIRREVVTMAPRALRRTFTLFEFSRILPTVRREQLVGPVGRWQSLVALAPRYRTPPKGAASDDDVIDPRNRPVKAYKRMNAQIESAIAAIREWEAPTPVRESHM